MKTFFVEVDTNDADYVGRLVEVSNEDAEKWMPLIEKIKNFKPYSGVSKHGIVWEHHHNFPFGVYVRTDLGEKSPCELYNISEEEMEAFQEAFWLWGGEYGFHSITKIVEVKLINKLI
jgi:hypothetical protein